MAKPSPIFFKMLFVFMFFSHCLNLCQCGSSLRFQFTFTETLAHYPRFQQIVQFFFAFFFGASIGWFQVKNKGFFMVFWLNLAFGTFCRPRQCPAVVLPRAGKPPGCRRQPVIWKLPNYESQRKLFMLPG